MKRCYRWILFLSAFAFLVPATALAFVNVVEYPAHVEVGEAFLVRVEGDMPELCWEYNGWTLNAYSDRLVVYIDTYRTAASEEACPAVVIPYEVLATIPGQEEGVYVLRIYENRTPRDPIVLDYEITVGSPVETEPWTWESLKALYR